MSATTGSEPAPGNFDALDDAKINRFQLKIMFVSGMGFFTDAYDLFVIGIVVALLKTEWSLSTSQVSWINSATLLASGLSDDATWRILLALGAIPGLAVFYLRRQIHETPRFAWRAVRPRRPRPRSPTPPAARPGRRRPSESTARHTQGALDGFRILARHRRMLLWLIGTAGAWLLLDFCYYGNTISTPEILKLLNPHASLLYNVLVQLAIFAAFAVPGYIVAILLLDKTGRKSIQVLGFGMMALCFLLIGLVPGATTTAITFILLYGVSYFFTQFGPNTTTFIYPAELFPVEVRTTGHGISAGAGKLGAFLGAFLFPMMLASSMGIQGAEIVAGVVAVAGLLLTVALLPEPNGKSLEELSEAAYAGPELTLEAAS